jgi:hypothetical protein
VILNLDYKASNRRKRLKVPDRGYSDGTHFEKKQEGRILTA